MFDAWNKCISDVPNDFGKMDSTAQYKHPSPKFIAFYYVPSPDVWKDFGFP